jgi:pilus assembly protein CpaF
MFGRKGTDNNINSSIQGFQEEKKEIKRNPFHSVVDVLKEQVLKALDTTLAARLPKPELEKYLNITISQAANELRLQLSKTDQENVSKIVFNEIIGLGPLEELLQDPTISDILVNGPKQVYIEREGQLHLSTVQFQSEEHLLAIAQRIASRVGRRIDEGLPMVDARLGQDIRVNIVIPPLSLIGTCISIRKFRADTLTFQDMVLRNSMSSHLARFLQIAAASKLNIIVCGGTGSGKTTLLNALSQCIHPDERVTTIEDTAELQLHLPHVIRLEARPANFEGQGEVSIRDLVRNSLRMRPDRIIIGEVRNAEVVDMLIAMNTGHLGSMSTIHANQPRDALMRLETLAYLGGLNITTPALRDLIASAVNLIVYVERMRDGKRRVLSVTEVTGASDEVISTQELFKFVYKSGTQTGVQGVFKATGVRPHNLERMRTYGGYDQEVLNLIEEASGT